MFVINLLILLFNLSKSFSHRAVDSPEEYQQQQGGSFPG